MTDLSDSLGGRPMCLRCLKPQVTCYCRQIKPFASHIKFIILMHPHEAKIKANTGRMAHLCIKNSELIQGVDFEGHPRVQKWIKDPANRCMLLHPGHGAKSLKEMELLPEGKNRVIFLLDATWYLARKMYRCNLWLQKLPKVALPGDRSSAFQIKQQPEPHFLATIEAIHQVLDLTSDDKQPAPHHNLMEVFHYMVQQQKSYAATCHQVRRLIRPEK